jgi:hypothetical protein
MPDLLSSEESTGIAVALVMTVVWPERDVTTSKQQGKEHLLTNLALG